MAFGMANPMKMQEGIDKLECQGVTKIIVVPLFISSYSPIIRQNEYLLGFRDTLADPPMMMMHNTDGGSSMNAEKVDSSMQDMKMQNAMTKNHGFSREEEMKEMELKPLTFKSKLILTKPFDSHPLNNNPDFL